MITVIRYFHLLSLTLILGCWGEALLAQAHISRVEADAFPEIKIWLQGEIGDLPQFSFVISEGGELISPSDWQPATGEEPVKIALLVDRSFRTQRFLPFDSTADQLTLLRDAAHELLESLRPEVDSVMLIHFGGSIDNTDLSDNFMVLSLILEGIQSRGERVVYDALVYAAEALGQQKGRKAVLLLVAGGDEGSTSGVEDIKQLAATSQIPLLIAHLGLYSTDWDALAQETGGGYIQADEAMTWEIRVDSLVQAWRQQHTLSYQASGQATGNLSLGVTTALGDTSWLSASYELPQGQVISSHANAKPSAAIWPWLLAAGVVLLLGLGIWGAIRLRQQRQRQHIISPTITQVAVHAQRQQLIITYNLPPGRIPARVSIFSYAGRPVRDMVVPAGRQRAKLDLAGLEDGVYRCQLAHAGLVSEEQEFLWET